MNTTPWDRDVSADKAALAEGKLCLVVQARLCINPLCRRVHLTQVQQLGLQGRGRVHQVRVVLQLR